MLLMLVALLVDRLGWRASVHSDSYEQLFRRVLRNRRINRHQLRSNSLVFRPPLIAAWFGCSAWCSPVLLPLAWLLGVPHRFYRKHLELVCSREHPSATTVVFGSATHHGSSVFGLADARILALPMTFGAALLLREKKVHLRRSAVGLLLGLSALMRPEAQTAAVLAQ